MPCTEFYTEPFGSLYYDDEFPFIMYRAHNFMTGQQFRDMLEVQLQAYREKRPLHKQLFVIGDTRKQKVIAPAEQKWLDEYWNVEMYNAGLREIAFIAPESAFGEVSMKGYTENTQSRKDAYSIVTPLVKSMEDAKAWLETRRI